MRVWTLQIYRIISPTKVHCTTTKTNGDRAPKRHKSSLASTWKMLLFEKYVCKWFFSQVNPLLSIFHFFFRCLQTNFTAWEMWDPFGHELALYLSFSIFISVYSTISFPLSLFLFFYLVHVFYRALDNTSSTDSKPIKMVHISTNC